MHQGGTALLLATEGLIENARRLAARLLQTGVDAVNYEAGMLRVAATGQEVSLDEVARVSYEMPSDDVAPGLAHKATHLCDRYTFPNGCHVAEVEIDPATGEVRLDRYVIFDDYGRLLDPRQTLGPGTWRRGAGHRPGAVRARAVRCGDGPESSRAR